MCSRKLCEEIPAVRSPFDVGVFQLSPSPEDCLFGARAESVRIKESSVVVVAQECQGKISTVVDTLSRIGTVADHVSETENLIDIRVADIVQNRRERFKIPMNVADDRSSCHGS